MSKMIEIKNTKDCFFVTKISFLLWSPSRNTSETGGNPTPLWKISIKSHSQIIFYRARSS